MHPSTMFSPLLLILLSLLSLSTASSILTITIPPSTLLPNPHTLPPTTHATLTSLSSKHELLKAPLSRSSSFTFPNLNQAVPSPSEARDGTTTATSYLLDIYSRDYVFAPYRVDVSADGDLVGVWETYRGNPWDNKGPEKVGGTTGTGSATGPVQVEAKVLARREFYEERPKFSPLSLFKNPMILLAIFALGMTFGMPYLINNMDPEMREEFEKQRATGGVLGVGSGKAAGPNFDLAGWMAGTSPGPMEAAKIAHTSGREGGSGQPDIRRR